jgi:hypothetical protein
LWQWIDDALFYSLPLENSVNITSSMIGDDAKLVIRKDAGLVETINIMMRMMVNLCML